MFYEDLKHQIEQLLTQKKHQIAINLINKELAVPYIPQDFEFFLRAKKKEAQNYLQQGQKIVSSAIDLNEIIAMLNTNNTSSHLMAIDAFDKINIRLIRLNINKFLLRRDVANDVKSLILIALHRQDINEIFDVWHDQELLKINPRDLQVEKLSNFNKQVVKKLEKTFFNHNQSLMNLAVKIALLFLLDFFPKDFYFSVPDVAAMAIKRAGKMLNETITWDQILAIFPFNLKTATIIFGHQIASLD